MNILILLATHNKMRLCDYRYHYCFTDHANSFRFLCIACLALRLHWHLQFIVVHTLLFHSLKWMRTSPVRGWCGDGNEWKRKIVKSLISFSMQTQLKNYDIEDPGNSTFICLLQIALFSCCTQNWLPLCFILFFLYFFHSWLFRLNVVKSDQQILQTLFINSIHLLICCKKS